MIDDETTQSEAVPAEYACPVCHKWGRRVTVLDLLRAKHKSVVGFSGGNAVSAYYCNPKARKGGKGCGEIFRVITPDKSSCAVYVPKWKDITGDVDLRAQHERMIDLGHEAIRRLKESGRHNPMVRNSTWESIYHVFYKPTNTYNEPLTHACGCGCGRITVRLKDHFVDQSCKDVVYRVSEMIANPGRRLTKFICEHVNHSTACQHCQQDQRVSELELDHILEVNEGGGMCWLENFQVLCRQCHKAKTASYAALRAQRRRESQQAEDPQLTLF
jgi:5-methylcytosine-specific restriction endonuclease McrA